MSRLDSYTGKPACGGFNANWTWIELLPCALQGTDWCLHVNRTWIPHLSLKDKLYRILEFPASRVCWYHQGFYGSPVTLINYWHPACYHFTNLLTGCRVHQSQSLSSCRLDVSVQPSWGYALGCVLTITDPCWIPSEYILNESCIDVQFPALMALENKSERKPIVNTSYVFLLTKTNPRTNNWWMWEHVLSRAR